MNRIAALLACAALASAAAANAQNREWRGDPRASRPAPAWRGFHGRMMMNPAVGPRRGFVAPPPGGYYPRPIVGQPPNSLGAGWREQQDEARWGVRRGAMAPLGRVIGGIDRRTPGRQLDAGIEYENGRAVYRVRWLTRGGRRIDYIVDAATGAILRGG